MTRQVLQFPDTAHGGTPCPILEVDFQCNTHFCQDTINGWGYLSWGPIYGGPAGQAITITYNIYSNPDNVDIFLFAGDDNYLLYIQDSQRPKAWNTGYKAVAAMLNTDNAFQTIQLEAGVNYYLVVDNTPVGAANGNNGNYQQETIGYNVTGFDLSTIPPPLNTADAARFAAPSILFAFCALLAGFFGRL